VNLRVGLVELMTLGGKVTLSLRGHVGAQLIAQGQPATPGEQVGNLGEVTLGLVPEVQHVHRHDEVGDRRPCERAGVPVDQLQTPLADWTDTASGRLARRPEWDNCLEYLRAGDELVITRLSRMARSVRHLTEVAALFAERGVDLVVLKQGIDTTTPAGRSLFHVIGAMDEMLADLISEGTLEGLEAARARGRTGGRKPKLTERQVRIARQMYDENGADGKRRYTVAEIAETFHVSRKTIYPHLDGPGRAAPADQAQ